MRNPVLFLRIAAEVASSSPATLLSQWKRFVEECAKGFQWDISEYNNELSVRTRIELILSEPRLQTFDELTELVANVAAVDEQFRELLQPQVARSRRGQWWDRAVLKHAGAPYVEYMRLAGIRAEPKERVDKD